MIKKSKINTKNLRIFASLVCIFGILFLVFDFAKAQPISSTELINNAKQYDAKTVVYEGEVIGDIMVRGEFAWINVNDGKNAIGIWIDKNLTRDIQYSGSYKFKGDWIEITGVFQRACPQHGGDLDIHAQSIKNIQRGRLVQERINLTKNNFTIGLLGILVLVWILSRLKRK
jgi:hypothetical protein